MAAPPPLVAHSHGNGGTHPVPMSGQVASIALSMITVAILAICITRRLQTIGSWRELPITGLLLLMIYIDSAVFVFVTALLARGFGMDSRLDICHGVILLCLVCYMTTKVLIYLFLVEKAYIVRGSREPRLKNKFYLFNFFFMICPYIGVFALNITFRFAYIDTKGMCIVGMKRVAMIPLVSFEVVVNVYLTMQFILPIRSLYSFKNKKGSALRQIALRTFIGSCATLTSSVANITTLLVLQGEPGWVCMMCCNADILFCVMALHWVTSIDRNRSQAAAIDRLPLKHHSTSDRVFDGTGGSSYVCTCYHRRALPLVTTHIEASSDVEDLRMHVPTEAISVKTEQVVHIDTLPELEQVGSLSFETQPSRKGRDNNHPGDSTESIFTWYRRPASR